MRAGNALVLLGHRDEESSARAASLARRGMMCPLTAGRCSSYYFNVEGNSIRIYPIRSWTTAQVWDYLKTWRNRINLDDLFRLYMDGAIPARYGCWHCTLVKRQLGHYILGGNHMYFEAVRVLYRLISDLPWMRIPKDRGYSKLGPLTPAARAIIAKLILTAEKLSGIKLYGLDESKLEDYTLRQILFEIPENEANKIIRRAEAIHIKKDPQRFVDIESIRDVGKHREQILKFMEYVNGKFGSKKERMKLEELEEYINTMTDNLLE